ncbi:alpha-L-fucosidase [Bacteroidota bacterium]
MFCCKQAELLSVLSTKHHDGFALWPTKNGNYNIDDRKDLLALYVKACRKYGLKVGFYFSQHD